MIDKDIVVVDLDGTLALDAHRNHYLHNKEGKRDWDAYFGACGGDGVNAPVAYLVGKLFASGSKIYILSGRIDRMREVTKQWLTQHGIPYDCLMMRETQDRTQDTELKLKWVKQLGIGPRIWFVLEDRARVVAAWREAGFTCLQVAPGDF